MEQSPRVILSCFLTIQDPLYLPGEMLNGAPGGGRLMYFFHFLIVAPAVVLFFSSCLLIVDWFIPRLVHVNNLEPGVIRQLFGHGGKVAV